MLCDPSARMNIFWWVTDNFSALPVPLPLKWVWVSLVFRADGNRQKQVIMNLRIRRQSTMRTKDAKMNTRSIAFDPFNSHGAKNFHAAHGDDWHQWGGQKIMFCDVFQRFSPRRRRLGHSCSKEQITWRNRYNEWFISTVAKCYLCLEFNCLYIITKDVGGCNITPVRECRSAILFKASLIGWLVKQVCLTRGRWKILARKHGFCHGDA